MNLTKWSEFLESLQSAQKSMLQSKRSQYSTEDDVFYNFRDAAILNHETMEKALWGFVSKHIVTVRKMIDEDSLEPNHTLEEYKDKVMDIYNYMPLLLAIIAEREGVAVQNKPEQKDHEHAWTIDDFVKCVEYPQGLYYYRLISDYEITITFTVVYDESWWTVNIWKQTSIGNIPRRMPVRCETLKEAVKTAEKLYTEVIHE